MISLLASLCCFLPSNFQVTERYLALTPTFDVYTPEQHLATARKNILSLSTHFEIEDAENKPLATAQARLFAWGTVVDVYDPEGKKIGWIEEELFRILPWAEYRLFSEESELLAIARMNFFGTCFELCPPDNLTKVYATIQRPFFRFLCDYWTVEMKDHPIDSRLLVVLAICQSDKDSRDRLRSEVIGQISQNIEYETPPF